MGSISLEGFAMLLTFHRKKELHLQKAHQLKMHSKKNPVSDRAFFDVI
jgi:hypothetical protein